jgi:hypothetical protein
MSDGPGPRCVSSVRRLGFTAPAGPMYESYSRGANLRSSRSRLSSSRSSRRSSLISLSRRIGGERLRGLHVRSRGSWCLSRSSLWNGRPLPAKSLPPRPRPMPLPRYVDPAPRGGGSEYVDPAEGGPSRELRRARLISRSRGTKSLWSRGSLKSRMGDLRGGVGRLSLRSKSRSRSRSRSALQELWEFAAGPLLRGGAVRKGVSSPRPAKPLPRPSRGAEGALDGGPAAGPRGGSPSDLGPRGGSRGDSRGGSRGGKPAESGIGRPFGSLPLGGYPPPKFDGLRSRYGDLSRGYLLLSGYRLVDMMMADSFHSCLEPRHER